MIPTRIELAWHVLRGRPLAYRLLFVGASPFSKEMENSKIVECAFSGMGPILDTFDRANSRELGPNWTSSEVFKLPPLPEGEAVENSEWLYGGKSDVEWGDVELRKIPSPEEDERIKND